MTTISQVADRIGEHICRQAGLESEVKKVCFGIEVMMVMSVSILITIFLGGLFGLMNETLLIISTALLAKFIIGGPHLSGFFRCLIYSISIILFGALTCKIYPTWLSINMVLSLVVIDLVILINAPLFPSYRILEPKQVLTRKLFVTIILMISSGLFINRSNLFSAGALIGFSISILNISPMGTNFMKWLDRITKQGGAGQ